MSEALDHLATRVATDPLFLACALAEYSYSEGLDDPALAAALGCQLADLTRLRLCGAPRSEPDTFRADIAAIAARFRIDPGVLGAAVRRGQTLTRLRAGQPATGALGWLAAARDGESPAPPPEGDKP